MTKKTLTIIANRPIFSCKQLSYVSPKTPYQLYIHYVVFLASISKILFHSLSLFDVFITTKSVARTPWATLPTRRPFCYFLRSRYSPVAVSTLTISPCLMNAGTLITRPVSSVASLSTLEVVSPFTTSSVYVTSR